MAGKQVSCMQVSSTAEEQHTEAANVEIVFRPANGKPHAAAPNRAATPAAAAANEDDLGDVPRISTITVSHVIVYRLVAACQPGAGFKAHLTALLWIVVGFMIVWAEVSVLMSLIS